MQGFAADIFTGGPRERALPGYAGLRPRWAGDSHGLIADLARLWANDDTRARLVALSDPHRPPAERALGVAPALDLLRASGSRGAVVFVEALEALKGPRIARKTVGVIRSYIQNAHLLHARHGGSFRAYLQGDGRRRAAAARRPVGGRTDLGAGDRARLPRRRPDAGALPDLRLATGLLARRSE